MLAHRTGITRHDSIWYKSDFTRKELFDRLRFLEPREPIRQTFLYNNLMFAGVGYMIELQSGKTWEEFVRERIFGPLEMTSTVYSIPDMLKQPDHGVRSPRSETRPRSTRSRTTRTSRAWPRAEPSFPTSRTCPTGSSRS
jgi:CubicO group peptidase (beta-lactamase class C family)